MVTSNVNIENTPMFPYQNLLNSMNRNEKIAVALFLVNSLPGIEIVETDEKQAIDVDEDDYLSRKLSDFTFSPRIERLFEKRKEASQVIDLEDERTRHILGL